MSRLLGKALLVIAAAFSATTVHGQSGYPDRPIQIVVPFVAGSSLDAFTRMIAQKLGDRLGQPVVVLNKAGAGGVVGAEFVTKAPADGYTFLAATNGLAIAASAYSRISFSPTRDLDPITQLSSSPHVLLVPNNLKANSIADLIALAKAEPGKLNFAGGLGNSDQLAGELFKSMAKIDIVHIPYGGGPPALTDTISGRVQMYFSGMVAGLPMVQAGKLKALGVSSKQRTPLLPEVPAVAETLPGYEVDLWYGLLAPAGTPADVIAKINTEVRAVLKQPDIQERALKMGVEPVGSTTAEFKEFFAHDTAKWARVIKSINLKLD